MNWIGYHVVQQEVADKAVAKERSRQARRVLALQRQAARERRSVGRPRHDVTGWREISKEEAAAIVAKKNRRGALRLIHTMLGGRTVR